jgi:hypothetical protein
LRKPRHWRKNEGTTLLYEILASESSERGQSPIKIVGKDSWTTLLYEIVRRMGAEKTEIVGKESGIVRGWALRKPR